MIIESFSSDDTKHAGLLIGTEAKRKDIFCLTGDLGAGKTMFSKGFAQGLLLENEITSPTFTIVNEYEGGRIPFYHFDVYRLKNSDELWDLGFEDYLYGNGVCLIEWADIVKEDIPENAIWICIKKDLTKGENYRIIEIDESLC